MKKYIYDESNGLWYELKGDYCFPLPQGLSQNGKLTSYPVDINKQAEDMMRLLTKQIAERENDTEKLKAESAMLWVEE